MSRNERESDLDKLIPGISEAETVSDLEKLVGEMTPEEKSILADPSLHLPPTAEELASLGPNFGERIGQQLADRLEGAEPKLSD